MLTPVHQDEPQSILVTSLEQHVWIRLQTDLALSLSRLKLSHFADPSEFILRDLLENAAKAMHLEVFRHIVEYDFGLDLDGNDTPLKTLYRNELHEHGLQNISRFCENHDWHIRVTFPAHGDTIVSMSLPVKWDAGLCRTGMLLDALGYRLCADNPGDAPGACVVALKKYTDRRDSVMPPKLLDQPTKTGSLQHIYDKLGYGLILFSTAGTVLAASPSMLRHLQLDITEESLQLLCEAIPATFYNDVVWGMALAGNSGTFENYRLRIRSPQAGHLSILFNVSGFRDAASVVHTLWQTVSLEKAGDKLSEGSMLSEVRIYNITRNYVPQLVEEKAREAVRLDNDTLGNEECCVAVLFCDIVGFTSYVESHAGNEPIINTLNSILRRVSSSVKRFSGSIDKFMGDCVMALFKDPANAVYAALDMQSHSIDINSMRSRAGQETLQLRIGINWGEVVIGNVGTAERLDWTAIGDVVNTASRIEKGCHPGSILLSQTVRDAIVMSDHSDITFGEIFPLRVKGKRDELAVCYVKRAR